MVNVLFEKISLKLNYSIYKIHIQLLITGNYMHWRLVKSLGPDISPEIRHLSFQFEQIFTGATVEQPRYYFSIMCVVFAFS